MLSDADMKFPTVPGEDGKSVELTHSNYIPLMMSRDRAVRRAAFTAMYETYKGFSATIPAIYSASVKSDVFYARAAKHDSALAGSRTPCPRRSTRASSRRFIAMWASWANT